MSTRLRPARLRWPPAPVATGPSRFPRAQPPQVAAHIGGSSAPPLKTSVTFGDKVDGIGQRQRADPGGCRKGPPGGARWNRRGGSPGPAAGSAVGSARWARRSASPGCWRTRRSPPFPRRARPGRPTIARLAEVGTKLTGVGEGGRAAVLGEGELFGEVRHRAANEPETNPVRPVERDRLKRGGGEPAAVFRAATKSLTRLTWQVAGILAVGLLLIAGGVFVPGVAWQVTLIALGVLVGSPLAILVVSRRIAFRADREGLTFGPASGAVRAGNALLLGVRPLERCQGDQT